MLEDRGLADTALSVDDEDMIDELARQGAFDSGEHILPAEEHARFEYGRSSDIGIDIIWHDALL